MGIFISAHRKDDPPWLPAMARPSESLLDRQQMLHSGGYAYRRAYRHGKKHVDLSVEKYYYLKKNKKKTFSSWGSVFLTYPVIIYCWGVFFVEENLREYDYATEDLINQCI